jgi:hypothetical protein
MAFCDVEVFRPGEDSEAFQVGTTDPNGAFGFVPDTTGTWRLTVDDGMGHMATAELIVDPDGIRRNVASGRGRLPGVIVGVGVIFGLFGALALFFSRRRQGR